LKKVNNSINYFITYYFTEKKGDKEDEEEDEDEDEEDVFEVFMFENSTEDGMSGKFKCKYCKGKTKYTFKNLKTHFIDTHKKEFEELFGKDGKLI